MSLQNTYKFNRFPIRKDRFFALIINLSRLHEFGGLFFCEPRVYDKVYVTISDNELINLGKRLGICGIQTYFKVNDAIFSFEANVIILHVPAMVKKLYSIPSNTHDPNRRILFTIHFFACLFHELAHGLDIAYTIVARMGDDMLESKKIKSKPLKEKRLEKFAKDGEEKYMSLLKNYLDQKQITWFELSEYLFDWDKLQKHVTPTNLSSIKHTSSNKMK